MSLIIIVGCIWGICKLISADEIRDYELDELN